MIGPDRNVHGGISGVVNQYYEAGLDKKIKLKYIGTMKEGSKLYKLAVAALAYVRFVTALPGYDIVHVNVASDSSFIRKSVFIRTAKLFGKKLVIHQHGGDFTTFYYKESSEKNQKKIREVLNMADVFLVLAPFWKDFFAKLRDPSGIVVLPNSINIPDAYHKKYDQKKILFLGRLCEAKGIRELLMCIRKLRAEYEDVQLYVGGIWEDKELWELAKQNQDAVTFLGWIDGNEKAKWLRECDIFVLPSYFEGQPVSVLEAMANYCGVVATRTGGIPMMVEDGFTGVLVEPKNAGDLYRGLSELLGDPKKCERLGLAAREKVEKEFSIEQSIKVLVEEIYERIG